MGSAPAFEAWKILSELIDKGSGIAVWQGISSLSLESFLPATTPSTVLDSYLLPARLPLGEHVLGLRLVDPTGYRPSLALAIEGRSADGSSSVGTILIGDPAP